MPERLVPSCSGGPREQGPPLGHLQYNVGKRQSTRSRRLRPRDCLRQGCGRVYQPRRWNQRYCQDPECLKRVGRWQAVKRQQQRRSRPEVREAHAAAERNRRARHRAADCTSTKAKVRSEQDLGHCREGCCSASLTRMAPPEGYRKADGWAESRRPAGLARTGRPEKDPAAPGDHHKGCCPAAPTRIDPTEEDPDAEGRAWSRSKKIPTSFCDRPGCYQAVRSSHWWQARYCSDGCRQAMKRMHDRERKWLVRDTEVGRFKRSLEYEAARQARWAASSKVETQATSPRVNGRQPVVNSRPFAPGSVPCRDPKEGPADDREKNPGHRPRAPPST